MIKWLKKLFKRRPRLIELPLKQRLTISYLKTYNGRQNDGKRNNF